MVEVWLNPIFIFLSIASYSVMDIRTPLLELRTSVKGMHTPLFHLYNFINSVCALYYMLLLG
jgi:hypothetical protein